MVLQEFVVNYKALAIVDISACGFKRIGIYAIQPGFAFETGRIIISYNYFFDAFKRDAKESLLTHSNMITLILSLNNVDK